MRRTRRLPLPKSGIAPNGIKYAVKYDRDWQEWQVRAYKRSRKTGAWKFAEGPTCYCGDREEAISTFHHLVGYAPGYTRANPRRRKSRRNPYNIEKSAFHRGEYVGYGAGVWRIWRYYRNGDFIAVKSRGGPRKELRAGTLSEMSKLLAGEESPKKTNPPKVIYYIQAQGYGPGPAFGTKGETIRAVQDFVREDVRNCRRKFGAAFVERRRDTWEVRPLRYSSPHTPMWSRYSVLSVISNALG